MECVSEKEALSSFFDFLKSVGPNVILCGMDEETVGQFSVCLFTSSPQLLVITIDVNRRGPCSKAEGQRQGQVSKPCRGLHMVEEDTQAYRYEIQVRKPQILTDFFSFFVKGTWISS